MNVALIGTVASENNLVEKQFGGFAFRFGIELLRRIRFDNKLIVHEHQPVRHSTGKPHSVGDAVHHHIAHREVDHHVKHRCRITLIGCRTGRLEPCSIWWRQLVPQAAMCSLALA